MRFADLTQAEKDARNAAGAAQAAAHRARMAGRPACSRYATLHPTPDCRCAGCDDREDTV